MVLYGAGGDNEKGQLGDETYYGSHTAYPVRIISSGVSSVSLGWKHTCAVKTDGSLWCWGYNGYGQVGVPITVWPWSINVTSPVQIISSGTSAVSGGILSYLCSENRWFIMVLGG